MPSVKIVLTNQYQLNREQIPDLMEELAQICADYGLTIKLTEKYKQSAGIKSIYFGNHFGRTITAKAREEE